jgi:raffinose/stachyose/melibiose transport system substrate-binding protein
MNKRLLRLFLVLAIVLLGVQMYTAQAQQKVTLVIESWRTGDEAVWDQIIAAFKADNPDIDVKFQPTNPPDYNAALNAKLKSGTAGDLITCRPFDAGLQLYKDGNLTDVTKLKGMENFSDFAKIAWTTEDGKVTYCVPMASVLHGFIYNKDYFDQKGFKEPATYEEFLTLLENIKKDGMTPLAIGTKEGWTTTSMGFDNIGPNFWGGDAGRKGLIDGTRKYNDKGFVAAFEALSKWAPYLPKGHEAISYTDSQGLFTSGKAAIFPAGSWEIAGFNKDADFKMGAFKAPPPASANGKCVISDQLDIALGANAKSKNPEAAQKFLEFVATEKFAQLYGGGLPGFFPLGNFKIKLDDPLANTFLSWRGTCESALRSSYQKLSANPDHPTENNLWNVTSQLLQGKLTPQQAGDAIQADLDKWYKPAAKA